jgi:hypothetical protein
VLDSGEEVIESTSLCNEPPIRNYIEGKTFLAFVEDSGSETPYYQILQVSLNSSTKKLYNLDTEDSECYTVLQDLTIVSTTPNSFTEWELISEGSTFLNFATSIPEVGDSFVTYALENGKIRVTQTLNGETYSNLYEIYTGSIPATQCPDED